VHGILEVHRNVCKVWLLLSNSLSPVFDYIYRPAEIENMCLYDWVRCCEKRKLRATPAAQKVDTGQCANNDAADAFDASDASDDPDILSPENTSGNTFSLPKSVYHYTKEHPLHGTHGTLVKNDNSKIVVNFIGKPLPHCDQGDREYYCLCMLVLFKPWRSGVQLKEETASWDMTFQSHTFTERQRQLVLNFNIKYECLDA
jgi:hypothetical protein